MVNARLCALCLPLFTVPRMMLRESRPLDIVVYGATGFTGQLCALYVANTYSGQGLKWGIAGRSLNKLEELKTRLVNIDPALSKLPVLVADNADEDALRRMCEQSKVVLSTVGPYKLLGEPLVRATIAAGTHYCDLTGEIPFVRNMICKYNSAAVDRGVKVVHCCGFDCVPVDLGTLMAVQKLQENGCVVHEAKCIAIAKGSASGGTIASATGTVEGLSFNELAELRDPYYLVDNPAPERVQYTNNVFVEYDKDVQKWVYPYIMAGVDVPVVQRSAALRGYSPSFKYVERTVASGLLSAVVAALSLGLVNLLLLFAPFRWFLRRLVPQGTGPSEHAMDTGFFDIKVFARGTSPDGRPASATASVECRGADPGYKGTARMIVESALCLALQPERTPDRTGVLTPASGIGEVLVERLTKNSGFKFSVAM